MGTIPNSPVESSQSLSNNKESSKLRVRIYGVDGLLATFTQDDPVVAEHIVRDCQRPDFFKGKRMVVAGQHSVTTLVPSEVARIDLAGEGLPRWKPPSGVGMSIRDIVDPIPSDYGTHRGSANKFHI